MMVPARRSARLLDRYSSADDEPVIYVNWFEATLYARWRGARLPTQEEWEVAASCDPGQPKTVYPWGDKFETARCNTRESGLRRTTPVGAYSDKDGNSRFRCQDMAGNVWEWTASEYKTGSGTFVLRGGSWGYGSNGAACAVRLLDLPGGRNDPSGFRCSRTVRHEARAG